MNQTLKESAWLYRCLLMLLTIISSRATNVYAQKTIQARIDSMLQQLIKAKEDTNKAALLNAISVNYRLVNPDEGIKYGQQELELATKHEWKKQAARANISLGNNFAVKSQYDHALECFGKAVKIYEAYGDKLGLAVVTQDMSNVYMAQGKNSLALENYLKILKIYEELHDKDGTAGATLNIGVANFNLADYPSALKYYQKAAKLYEDAGDKNGTSFAFRNIGSVYQLQSDFPKALDNFLKALKIAEEIGDKIGIAANTSCIGAVYLYQGDYSKALEYMGNGLKIYEEIGEKSMVARITADMGLVYKNQGDYYKALEYYSKALKIEEEIGNKSIVVAVCINIGDIYTHMKNYTMGIEYNQKGIKIADEIGDKYNTAWGLTNIGEAYYSIVKDTAKGSNVNSTNEPLTATYKPTITIPRGRAALLHNAVDYLERGMAVAKEIKALDVLQEGYQYLAEVYKLTGNYKMAMEATDNYRAIKDSVFSKENAVKLVKLEMKSKIDADSLKSVRARSAADLKYQQQRNYTYAGMAGVALLLLFTYFMARNNKLLGKEKKRSEDLLLNILPDEVATELKDTGASAARHYDNVTVLFTDFVNFTEAGERMKPQALIDELHTCFKKFDEITTKYNVEKIKTIGDAYLAVAGLPTADPKHAENIVKAAIEINAFMTERHDRLGNSTFEVRIGIHSGSVVAGIVGVKKFAYDIWGDTVNTAARMEQNSEAGKINISQATYELLKDKFTCEYRGEIEAKNKGGMRMYFVG